MTAKFYEDVQVGDRFSAGPVELSEAEIVEFASRYDPQPMHMDPVWAATGPFHGLIASGWQTIGIVMRMIVQTKMFGSTIILGLGAENIRWPVVTRPGDRIWLGIEVASMSPSKSKPDFGVIKTHVTGRNQRDEIALSMTSILWVPRRPSGDNLV
ncbi:MAG TPA: MaoC family dehydratase [Bryobacteraceae bacterium]|nr:MaoC family dehydratase [Bryobacteraceae bacterium]